MSYPNGRLDDLNAEFVSETVDSLLQLCNKGIPKDSEDLRQRINSYFQFCEQRSMRPSIENLCLSLGTNRMSFWNWCNGIDVKTKDSEWQNICLQARQLVICFLETAHMAGKINPASAIFLLKNWANYRDTVQFENTISTTKQALTAAELPRLEQNFSDFQIPKANRDYPELTEQAAGLTETEQPL